MKLLAPCDAADFSVSDIDGKPLQLSGMRGKPLILSFFRDAACPFCNLRVYEYTQRYKHWSSTGVEVVAVFSSTADEVREFVTNYPRPFRSVADPELALYKQYGLGSSALGFIKGIIFKYSRIKAGKRLGAKINYSNPNATLMPADFLIGFDGRIVDSWYGRDVADHMPMKRIERFVKKVEYAKIKRQRKIAKRAEKGKAA